MEVLNLLVVITVLSGIYLMPTIIAYLTSQPQRKKILILNLSTSWTVIGWITIMIWPFRLLDNIETN